MQVHGRQLSPHGRHGQGLPDYAVTRAGMMCPDMLLFTSPAADVFLDQGDVITAVIAYDYPNNIVPLDAPPSNPGTVILGSLALYDAPTDH